MNVFLASRGREHGARNDDDMAVIQIEDVASVSISTDGPIVHGVRAADFVCFLSGFWRLVT